MVGLAAVVLTAFALLAATARAATPPPTFSVSLAPQPLVTAGKHALVVAKLSYATGASPTTLTNTFFSITVPAGSFDAADSDASCTVDTAGTLVRCTVGQVRAGDTAVRQVVLIAPNATSLTVSGTAAWNEGPNDQNPQPTNDTTSSSDTIRIVAGTSQNEAGSCPVGSGGSTLADNQAVGSGNQQATTLSFPANTQGLNCTPASIQDDQKSAVGLLCNGGTRLCVVSYMLLPLIPSGTATDTITFDSSLFPSPGPSPKPDTFRVQEVLGPTDTTPETVPLCSSGGRTFGGACEIGAVKFGNRGIQVQLSVSGGLVDPGYQG